MDATFIEGSCKIQLKQKSSMIYHILIESNLKMFGWPWRQAIDWDESQHQGTKKTTTQTVNIIFIITKYPLFRHQHGSINGHTMQDPHLLTKTNGMVENQHGRDLMMEVQIQHIHGPIDHLVDTHHGEGFIKKIKEKESQGEPFKMKGRR